VQPAPSSFWPARQPQKPFRGETLKGRIAKLLRKPGGMTSRPSGKGKKRVSGKNASAVPRVCIGGKEHGASEKGINATNQIGMPVIQERKGGSKQT